MWERAAPWELCLAPGSKPTSGGAQEQLSHPKFPFPGRAQPSLGGSEGSQSSPGIPCAWSCSTDTTRVESNTTTTWKDTSTAMQGHQRRSPGSSRAPAAAPDISASSRGRELSAELFPKARSLCGLGSRETLHNKPLCGKLHIFKASFSSKEEKASVRSIRLLISPTLPLALEGGEM